ncbi:SEC-C domain-containing protein [Candidatus Woesearchaeota archaeon]|nr:SEC-C domain-containing protein [Candidatus Woesearchaeota archaeon]
MNRVQYDLTDVDINIYLCIKEYHYKIRKAINHTANKDYEGAVGLFDEIQKDCHNLKQEAKARKDEKTANISYLLNTYVLLLKSINSFWKICDSLDYQSAWSPLQDGIDCLRTLQKFMANENQLLIKEIAIYLENIEKLYPYVYFNSIEAINKTKICSLCNKSPFDPECNHIAGNLYMGEMATIVIREVEFLGISLVKNPMDKRCIVFMNCDKENIENTPFKLIHTLIKSLDKPYHFFELKLTKRTLPRQYYGSWSENSLCPCGSEKPFKECCSNKEFIENPHYEILSKGRLIQSPQ